MKRAARIVAVALTVLATTVGCSKSGGSSSVGTGALTFHSPDTRMLSVNSATLTIEIDGTELAQVSALIGGVTLEGVRSGTSFFLFGIMLAPGLNTIDFTATDNMGAPLADALRVTSTAGSVGQAAPVEVGIAASPTVVDSMPYAVMLTIDTSIQATLTEILIDTDGDQVIDHTSAFSATVPITLPGQGMYKPRVTIRTASNLLFTSEFHSAPLISVVPKPAPDPTLNIPSAGSDLTDLVLSASGDTLFALSAAGATVRAFSSATGSLQQTIALPGALDPQGMAIDGDDNLYVADTGNHRVLRLLASTGYMPDLTLSPDGTFGVPGTGAGELNGPLDVAVGEDPQGSLKIFVADAGNNRIQRFDEQGVFELDLASSPAAAALCNPSGIVALRGGCVLVADTANDLIRVLSSDGQLLDSWGGGLAAGKQLSAPTRLSLSTRGLLVADTGNARFQRFNLDGTVQRVLDIAGRAAIDVTTAVEPRVLVAPNSGDTILVVPVPTDPPGLAPLDVVQAFLTALSSADFDAALSHLFPSVRQGVSRALLDPTTAATVVKDAGTIVGLAFAHVSSALALVTGERPGPEYSDFALERDPVSGRWLLTGF